MSIVCNMCIRLLSNPKRFMVYKCSEMFKKPHGLFIKISMMLINLKPSYLIGKFATNMVQSW